MVTGSLQLSDLIRKLDTLTASGAKLGLPSSTLASGEPASKQGRDIFVTPVEVHPGHGTGILLDRLFGGDDEIISIRSLDQYGGKQEFGSALRIEHGDEAKRPESRAAIFARIAEALAGIRVRRIICVPFLPDDAATAIAIHEMSGAPLCTWIMDDQNIAVQGIDDAAMRELLERSSLRLAISPEMKAAYQKKFQVPFFYVPPLAPARMLPPHLQVPSTLPDVKHGVLIGNLWSARWPELLRRTVQNSGVQLTYPGGVSLALPPEQLRADGIFPHDRLPEEELVALLRSTWFAVLTAGTMDESEDRRWMSQFSLPSRLVYMVATSHIPVIVLGSRATAAAHFVEQFGLGFTAEYEQNSFVNAVERIMEPDTNLAIRRRAFTISARFGDIGAGEWIWQSLALGRAFDQRFEDLLPASDE